MVDFQPSVADVEACSFHVWYPLFSKVSLRATSVKLSSEYLNYLNSDDSLVLPQSHVTSSANPSQLSEDYDESDFDVHIDDNEKPQAFVEFPDLDKKIGECIKDFDGAVFPKLNWSAPKDAAWISFNKTLKCTSPSDIYLLLKSSDIISRDLTSAFSNCEDGQKPDDFPFHLVVKKWYDVHPEREFRCFVKSRKLVALCQRHHLDGTNRSFLAENESAIVDTLNSFFAEKIRDIYPRDNYVFDAYWTKQERWRIMDFGLYGPPTDSILFTWEELENSISTRNGLSKPLFRFETDVNDSIIPHEMQHYGMPVDIVDLTTGSDPQKFMDLLKESVRRQNEESTSSSDDE